MGSSVDGTRRKSRSDRGIRARGRTQRGLEELNPRAPITYLAIHRRFFEPSYIRDLPRDPPTA